MSSLLPEDAWALMRAISALSLRMVMLSSIGSYFAILVDIIGARLLRPRVGRLPVLTSNIRAALQTARSLSDDDLALSHKLCDVEVKALY